MFKVSEVPKGMSLSCCFCWPATQKLTFTLKKGQGSHAQEGPGEPCARTCSAGDMSCSRPNRAPHLAPLGATSGTPVLVSLAPFSTLKEADFSGSGSGSGHWPGILLRLSPPGKVRSLCQDPSLCALSRHFVNGDLGVSWQMDTFHLCCS